MRSAKHAPDGSCHAACRREAHSHKTYRFQACITCKSDPKHKHRWIRVYTTGGGGKLVAKIGERCRCGECTEREATKPEARKLARDWKRAWKNSGDIHRVWHRFCKRFRTTKQVPNPNHDPKDLKSHPFFIVDDGWKYQGYEFMTRVRRYARRYPRDIFVHGIDDSYHASSDIVFILHRRRGEFWGTTVLVITQCDGQPPCQFFLYPGHLKDMFPTLTRINGLRSLERL